MENGLFYTPLTGASRAEIECGMAGKEEVYYQRMLHELTEQAQRADALGYDKLAISEHHFQIEGFEVPNNPIMLNAYLAAQTKNIKLGQLGILAAARHPLLVAEDIVLLDHMTQGRCFVGLARGAHTRSVNVLADKYGIKAPTPGLTDPAARQLNHERFVENFELMKMAWTHSSSPGSTGRSLRMTSSSATRAPRSTAEARTRRAGLMRSESFPVRSLSPTPRSTCPSRRVRRPWSGVPETRSAWWRSPRSTSRSTRS